MIKNLVKYIFRRLAKLILWRFKPKIIGITGSVGKTSAKEAIYAALKNRYRIRESQSSLNNEFGLPLTIIKEWKDKSLKFVSRYEPRGVRRVRKFFFWVGAFIKGLYVLIFSRKSKYPEVLILEYGADRPGDIKKLLEIARPNTGVITAIGLVPVHVEFYADTDAVAREKSKLIEQLSTYGFAILNFDDDVVMSIKERTRAKLITFGFNEGADVRIVNFENYSDDGRPVGIHFKLEYGGSLVPVRMAGVFGRAHAYAAAVGVAVGVTFNLNVIELADSLSESYKSPRGRMNLISGLKNTYIIDDCYNASPLSMNVALQTIGELDVKRKVAVLGDMLELGKYSLEAHESLGVKAARVVDILITVGPRGKFIADAAHKASFPQHKIFSFDTVNDAKKEIQNLIREGDLILVKASRAIGLERIVEELREPTSH